MQTFKFEALDQTGRPQRGSLTAKNSEEAISIIKGRGFFPTSVRAVKVSKTPESIFDGPEKEPSAIRKEFNKIGSMFYHASGCKGGSGPTSAILLGLVIVIAAGYLVMNVDSTPKETLPTFVDTNTFSSENASTATANKITAFRADKTFNIEHDGHTFIKHEDSLTHHPDCSCGGK